MNSFAVALVVTGSVIAQAPARAQAQPQAPGPQAVAAERYAGEAQIGDQPAMRVHLELAPDRTTGRISSPAGNFEIVNGEGGAQWRAVIKGEGGSGSIRLTFSPQGAEGTFDLARQAGRMLLERTELSASAFLNPRQKLDLSAAQWNEDLDRLVHILTTEHGSPFHHVSREAFEEEVRRVRAQLPVLTGVQAALAFRRLAAMIGDGHTWVALPQRRPRLPLELYSFEDGLRVVGAPADQQDILGARLVAVNGMDAEEVVRRLQPFIGQAETRWGYRAALPLLFQRTDLLESAGIGSGTRHRLLLELPNGQGRTIETEGVTGRLDLAPLGSSAPLWQRNPDQSFFHERWPDGTVYVNWRGYDELPERGAALLPELDANPPLRLIIDLRDSSGGDFFLGRAFIDQIRQRDWLNRSGKLYVLIGRTTFSAAMTNAVDFKTGTNAILVGEPAGAAPNNWQELGSFNLPNSSLQVGVSTRFYAFLPGAAEVRPDVMVPPVPADWGNERDIAVRYVLSLPQPAAAR